MSNEMFSALQAIREDSEATRVFEDCPRARAHTSGSPLVVDLAALWAGPLAASLLTMAGARVIKIESRTRPDAARRASGSRPRVVCFGLNV